MAKASRFTIVFAADGASITLAAGAHPPEVITLAAMPQRAREHCFQFGLETMTRNTVAGAAEKGWTDAQCHGYMARKVKSLVAGQLTMPGAEFHDFVTAWCKLTATADRAPAEIKLLAMDKAKRDAIIARPDVQLAMAEAKLARLTADVGNAPVATNLLDELQ